MEKSNITCGSNVYPCKGVPYADQEFVDQLNDYRFIRNVVKKRQTHQTSVSLKRKQGLIYHGESTRCTYAPNDPCIGYVEGQGMKCKCIHKECANIYKCNPDYKPQDSVDWTMCEEEKILYGNPDQLKKYYLVDLVSDEEKNMYKADPEEGGIAYPPLYEEETTENRSTGRPRGRRKQIIGYENVYFGDADNQLSPIWGYVDYDEDGGAMVRSKYGSSTSCVYTKEAKRLSQYRARKENSKKENAVNIEKSKEQSEKREEKKQIELAVSKRISDTYPLVTLMGHIEKLISENKNVSIILANKAELAYVSGVLTQAGIVHDIEDNKKTRVILRNAQDEIFKTVEGVVIISSTLLEQGWTSKTRDCWEVLSEETSIQEIMVSGRDFFDFDVNGNTKRWGCRNLYGATHIVIEPEDIELHGNCASEEAVKFVLDNGTYSVKTEESGEIIGNTTDYFMEALEKLKRENEILEYPVKITGVQLNGKQKCVKVKGIGHMKFEEY